MKKETPCVSHQTRRSVLEGAKNMKEKQTTKPQTKLPVDREAVRVLAIELGVPAAARRLGLNRNTVHSWARRYNWNLPERAGRPGIVPARDLHTQPGDVLLATHKELEGRTKSGLAQATTRAAEAAGKATEPLQIGNTAQLRDVCLAAARLFRWDGSAQPSVTYYGDDNRTVVLCDAGRRQQLIEQRQRLLEAESQGKVIELNGKRDGETVGRKTEGAAPRALPAPETQFNANVGAGNGTAAQAQPPDVHFQHMQSIGKAETWKTSEAENHAGMFGPYPEEYEVW